MSRTKRANELKSGDRIWIWGDIYTVKASKPARLSRRWWWRLDLWHREIGTVPTRFPRDYRDHPFTLVSARNA